MLVGLIVALFLPSFNALELTEDGNFIKDGDMLYRHNPYTRGIPINNLQWPNATMYYEFAAGNFTTGEKTQIREAMDVIEGVSCVKFNETHTEMQYMLIQNGNDCSSSLGYELEYGTINLRKPDCMHRSVILHELMHAIGFQHEHCRTDCDHYITIHTNNVNASDLDQFQICENITSDLIGLYPYDYESVTHYTWNTFALDKREPTITARNETIKKEDLGKAWVNSELSRVDIQKINQYYSCPAARRYLPTVDGTTEANAENGP